MTPAVVDWLLHSTLDALTGLLDVERVTGDRDRVGTARRTGEEYLPSRGLHRRLSTGEPVGPCAVHLAERAGVAPRPAGTAPA